jgi:DNA polymerase-4
MDCFYAAVEQRDDPTLLGKPVIVGGPPNSRGVVATASYEARKYGVKSAMSCSMAYRLCPEGIFVPPRFDAYKLASQQIRAIFYRYTDLVEPLSLDEAYLDVTENKLNIASAIQIAKDIRKSILDETRLTASAGVSVNKFVAKVASDMNKPDGLTFIPPEKVEEFMEALKIEKFFGVGKVTADKMHSLGINTGADLKALSLDELTELFGKSGRFYYQIVRGIDNRPVQPDREYKSLAAENTFAVDIEDVNEMLKALEPIVEHAYRRMKRNELYGRTLTLKIKYSDFKQITRSKTYDHRLIDEKELLRLSQELLLEIKDLRSVRLLGISVSNFEEPELKEPRQLKMELW